MRLTSRRGARRLLAATTALLAASALVACSGGAAGTTDPGKAAGEEAWLDELEPRVLKLADFSGDQTANFGAAMVKWEEAITERTDGKVTFENYWSASLLGATDTLPGVRDGLADIGLIIPSYYPQELPVGSWLSGLGNALSGSTVHDVAAGGTAAYENALTFEPLIEEYASQNLQVLQVTSSPAYNLLCTSPIESKEAAQGKRARSSGPAWTGTLESLGMQSVALAFNEAYEGLQRGVIDCMVINPNQLVSGLQLKDVVTDFVPVTFAQLQASTFVMNKEVWDSFPTELQQIVHEESGQAALSIWEGYLDIEAGAGELIAAGDTISVSDVSELEPVAQAQREDALASLTKNAPASVTDPEGMVKEYLDRIDYWTSVLVEQGYEVSERTPEAILEAFSGLGDVDLAGYYEVFEEELISSTMPD